MRPRSKKSNNNPRLSPIKQRQQARLVEEKKRISDRLNPLMDAAKNSIECENAIEASKYLDVAIEAIEATHYVDKSLRKEHINELKIIASSLDDLELNLARTTESNRMKGNTCLAALSLAVAENNTSALELLNKTLGFYKKAQDVRYEILHVVRHLILGNIEYDLISNAISECDFSAATTHLKNAKSHFSRYRKHSRLGEAQLLLSLSSSKSGVVNWKQADLEEGKRNDEENRFKNVSSGRKYISTLATVELEKAVQSVKHELDNHQVSNAQEKMARVEKIQNFLQLPTSTKVEVLQKRLFHDSLKQVVNIIKTEDTPLYTWVKLGKQLVMQCTNTNTVDVYKKLGVFTTVFQSIIGTDEISALNAKGIVLYKLSRAALDVSDDAKQDLVDASIVRAITRVLSLSNSIDTIACMLRLILVIGSGSKALMHVFIKSDVIKIALDVRTTYASESTIVLLVALVLRHSVVSSSSASRIIKESGFAAVLGMMRRYPTDTKVLGTGMMFLQKLGHFAKKEILFENLSTNFVCANVITRTLKNQVPQASVVKKALDVIQDYSKTDEGIRILFLKEKTIEVCQEVYRYYSKRVAYSEEVSFQDSKDAKSILSSVKLAIAAIQTERPPPPKKEEENEEALVVDETVLEAANFELVIANAKHRAICTAKAASRRSAIEQRRCSAPVTMNFHSDDDDDFIIVSKLLQELVGIVAVSHQTVKNIFTS